MIFFGHKCRKLVTLRSVRKNVMSERKKGIVMEILIPLGILAGWVILQIWVLPRFGVRT